MGLYLLVSTLGQRELRQNLEKQKTGLKNQLGKSTQRPTQEMDISMLSSGAFISY